MQHGYVQLQKSLNTYPHAACLSHTCTLDRLDRLTFSAISFSVQMPADGSSVCWSLNRAGMTSGRAWKDPGLEKEGYGQGLGRRGSIELQRVQRKEDPGEELTALPLVQSAPATMENTTELKRNPQPFPLSPGGRSPRQVIWVK